MERELLEIKDRTLDHPVSYNGEIVQISYTVSEF
jgi:hypothetical protein